MGLREALNGFLKKPVGERHTSRIERAVRKQVMVDQRLGLPVPRC